LRNGEVTGRQTPVGIVPKAEELDLTGLALTPADLDKLLHLDVSAWQEEMARRRAHLEQFNGLPEEIWAAHHRVAAALDAAASTGSARATR
jgi:phosphoenolpyruvate carboxykinase (GTP)